MAVLSHLCGAGIPFVCLASKLESAFLVWPGQMSLSFLLEDSDAVQFEIHYLFEATGLCKLSQVHVVFFSSLKYRLREAKKTSHFLDNDNE